MTTISEMFGYGLIVTAVGLGMCFIILIGLSYMLTGLKVISNKGAAQKKAEVVQVEKKEAPAEVVNEVTTNEVNEVTEDETELVAVISAALSTFMGSESNLVVKSIKRVGGNTPAWARVGRQEQMVNRL